MLFLFSALVLGAALIWLGRQRPRRGGWQTRLASLVLAVLAAAGALVSLLRGAWIVSALLAGASAWLWTRLVVGLRKPVLDPIEMSEQRARALLGVGPSASAAEIQSAYLRLIRAVHPDLGGTTGLAAELNAARDALLRR